MANLRVDNLTGTSGRNAIDGSVSFKGNVNTSGNIPTDYLSVADHDDLDMGTGDFTFECWLLATRYKGLNDPSFMGICSSQDWTSGGILIQVANTGVLRVTVPSGINALGTADLHNKTGSDWVHIAVTRVSGTIKGYVNGIEEISASHNVGVDFAHGGTCTIGENGINQYLGDYAFRGYISNLRLIKGTALYTAAFTPPTEKLKPIDGTVLLCCQDSDDPTQEATGKTITGFGRLQESNDIELVTNSGFVADISGWTTSGVQWTHSSGALMHFGNGNTQRNAYQNVTTVVGKRYVARVLASSAEASTAYWQIAGTTINYVADNNNSAQLEYRYYFTATSTSTQIRFYSYDSGNSSNVRSYWYLASIKLAPQGEAPKVLPPVGVDEGVVFEGDTKVNSQGYMYFPTGDTTQRGRGRGFIAGGCTPFSTTFDMIQIQSQGNTVVFGNLGVNSGGNFGLQGCASETRGLIGGGVTPSVTDTIEYITMANSGNSLDFGNLYNNVGRRDVGSLSNSTRGIWCGGRTPSNSDTIDYVTIATIGNAQDFGNLVAAANEGTCGTASPTRGIMVGGSNVNTIQYITISSTGSAQDFGDLTRTATSLGGVSNGTRAVFANGGSDTIDYITIATLGGAKDFGNSILSRAQCTAAMSNSIRGVFAGGYQPSPTSADTNVIDFIEIATTGNAKDFGDINRPANNSNRESAGFSDSHGGL